MSGKNGCCLLQDANNTAGLKVLIGRYRPHYLVNALTATPAIQAARSLALTGFYCFLARCLDFDLTVVFTVAYTADLTARRELLPTAARVRRKRG